MKTKIMKNKLWIMLIALAFLAIALPADLCFSLPEVDEVVNGDVQVSNPDSSTMNITASDKSIVNYKSFSIAENESVMITLPSSNSEILNRVIGNDASNIMGKLSCNGIVFLINRNGVYIGPNANIDVGSIVISTRDITNSNFLSSNYIFEKLSNDQLDSLILNKGLINIHEGGFGVLIAGGVENQGTIIAKLGTIAMASGDLVTLTVSHDGLISIAIDEKTASTIYDIDGKPITDQLKNTGTIEADGGVVLFNADSANSIFEKAVNLEGYVKADKVGDSEGTIKILASGNVHLNADISADLIQISDPAGLIATNVNIEGGTLSAAKEISILATDSITNKATIQATGLGSVYMDCSGDMTPGAISTEYGAIKVGTVRAPSAILGTPHYIHTEGDIEIVGKSTGDVVTTLETSRGDVLRYATQGNLTLEAPKGAVKDLTITPLTADVLSIIAPEIVVNSAANETIIYKTGADDMYISASARTDDLIRVTGDKLDVTYLYSSDITLRSDNTVNTAEGVVISGSSVKVIANRFGSTSVPLSIDADITHIVRTNGEINIATSTGLGTTIMITGPPEDGFGQIIYNHSTDLVLEASRTSVSADENPAYLFGNITFYNFECTTPQKEIIFEAGYTYTFKENLHIEGDGWAVYLKSSVPGEQWYIDIDTESYILTVISVQDSYNISGFILHPFPARNEGNNVNWNLNSITWTGAGSTSNWSTSQNWSPYGSPSGQDVVFNNGSVSSTADYGYTINSLTINGYTGTISMSQNLTIDGAYSQATGTFTASRQLNIGTTFDLTGGTFNAPGFVGWSVTVGGDVDVTGGTLVMGDGAFKVRGDMTVAPGTFTKSSSGLSNLVFASGTATQKLTTNGNDMGNIKIESNTTNTTLTLQDALDCDNITINTNQTLNPNNLTITCGGNWTNWGNLGFTYGTGTVIFNGTAQVITGTTTFYNFTKTVASADTLYFYPTYDGTTRTYTFAAGGTLTLKGAAGNLLKLRCYSDLLPFWNVQVNGATDIDYVDVQSGYSNGYAGGDAGLLIGAPVANRLVNSGHNWGWFYNYTWDGSASNNWSDANNWTYNSGTPATSPGQYDTAVISAGTPAIDANVTALGYLRVNGGTLAVSTYSLTATEIYNAGTITVTSGTIDSNDEFTVGTLTCNGASNIYVGRDWLGVTAFTPSSSTVTLDCAIASGVHAYITSNGKAFNNLVLDDSSVGVIFKLSDALTAKNLTLSGTSTFDANDYDVAVTDTATINTGTEYMTGTGDNTIETLDNSGTFDVEDAGAADTIDITTFTNRTDSTVEYTKASGTSYVIPGTYYNLTCTIDGLTLKFAANEITKVTGTATLYGEFNGSKLNLASTTLGTYWWFNPSGDYAIYYVNVTDSVNMRDNYLFDWGNYVQSTGSNTINWFQPDPNASLAKIPEPPEPLERKADTGNTKYEEGEKNKERYPKGRYRTTVIVFEGVVRVASSGEKGTAASAAEELLTAGQSASQTGQVL